MKRFEGKVALVIGGSSGIGKAAAMQLVSEGAKVAVTGRSVEKSQQVADAIVAATGGEAVGLATNVLSGASIAATVDAVKEKWGRIDVLINSAGVWYPTPIGEAAEEEVNTMVLTNLSGTFLAMNAVVPIMKTQGGGKIVNLSSVAAFVGSCQFSVYCAVKSGVMMMTRAAALELGPFNINVNAVAPGNTATPMNEHIRTAPENAEKYAMIKAATPSPKAFSDPEEIANIIVFLASDEGRPMHGSTILADEGRAAGWAGVGSVSVDE